MAESLRRRKAKLDPNRVCTVHGCSSLVGPENLGSLCLRHKKRMREAGHAWHPIPRGKQRKAARKAVVRYLEDMSNHDAVRLVMFMNRAANLLREPLSNALKPSKIRGSSILLTTKGKAQIVWAWLSKREDFDRLACRLLIEAMTLEVWAKCFYEGSKAELPRLLYTTVGRSAVWLSHIQDTQVRTVTKLVYRNCYPVSEGPMKKITVEEPQTDKWRPSNYVRVAVGKRVFEALREILLRDWVTDQMIADTLTEARSA